MVLFDSLKTRTGFVFAERLPLHSGDVRSQISFQTRRDFLKALRQAEPSTHM